MSDINLPPAPPPASEADYGAGNARKKAAGIPELTGPALVAADMAVPGYLQGLPQTPSLNTAVAEVLAAATDNVPKRGHNKFHNYDYATADDLREHVARIIGPYGLAIEQHQVRITPLTSAAVTVDYLFRLTHCSGEVGPFELHTVIAPLIINANLDDKAFSKARVLALKDWSKTRLQIATGDPMEDPDADQLTPIDPTARLSAPPPRTVGTPSAPQAFRNAGLPPKDEPSKSSDPWLSGVLASLDEAKPGLAVLTILTKTLPQATSATQVAMIKAHLLVKATHTKAPDDKRAVIETLFADAAKRLAASFEPSDPVEPATPEPAHAGD